MRWHEIVMAAREAAKKNELSMYRMPHPDRCRDVLVLSPSSTREIGEKIYATEFSQRDWLSDLPVHPSFQWQEVAVSALHEAAGKNPSIMAVFAKYQGMPITGIDVLAELIAALELAHEKGKI